MTKPDGSVDAGSEPVTKRRRGKWTAQQRRRIVADSRVAGATVQEVAERHGVRANLVSAWRRRDDASCAAKPVKFAAGQGQRGASGRVDRDRSGRRVRGIVDGTMLREVLEKCCKNSQSRAHADHVARIISACSIPTTYQMMSRI